MQNLFQQALPFALAAVGYVFTSWHSQEEDRRSGRIARVNEQVKELYGPLLMCITSTKSAYDAMVRQHSHDGSVECFFTAVRRDPNGHEARVYRNWVKEVFMPLNSKAAAIVISRADLLESPTIDNLLLQFVAHVSAYQVIVKQWEAGELSAYSVVPFPDELHDFIKKEYTWIKKRQADLLGIVPAMQHRQLPIASKL